MVNIKNYIKRYPLLVKALIRVQHQVKKGSIRQIYHWLLVGHIIKWWRIKSWLNSKHKKQLQIGGGFHTKLGEEWLNGDLICGEIYLDATKRLPFPDNSLDIIFTEQFFEHLSQEDGLKFLYEVYRVLRPNGIIRQSTPDLNKLVLLYQDNNELVSLSNAVTRHMRNHRKTSPYAKSTGCQFINDIFRLWGHQFIYDQENIREITEEVGFRGFRWVSFGESDVNELKNLEMHADEEWMKNGFVMIYEAQK